MLAHDAVSVRVVAVHKETSIVRGPDGMDRSAVVSGRFRFEALAPSDYPAVGDWVTLADNDAAKAATAVITAVLPRRSAFVRSAADAGTLPSSDDGSAAIASIRIGMQFCCSICRMATERSATLSTPSTRLPWASRAR